MKKYFYHDIVDFGWVLEELDLLDITQEEKKDLLELAHSHLHGVILDAILSELDDRDKKIFLANLEYEQSDRVLKHLSEKIEKVEEIITKAADELKKDLKKDLQDAKGHK